MGNRNYKIAEDIFFSAAIFRLSKGEKDIKLSNKEAELLEMLCDEAGTVIPRGTLQESLWPNQDNTDTNLNRQILSLRRKMESFGLLNAIDTIPRVGYIFCAPVEIAGETEEMQAVEEQDDRRSASQPQVRRQYTRRKYDRYLNPRRIVLFTILFLSLCSLAIAIYNHLTANTLRAIDLGHVSIYMTSDTEDAFHVKIASLAPLVKRIPQYKNEQVSILIGKEAISYFSIDNKNQLLSENIFLLRNGHLLTDELQCVMATVTLQGNNVTNNYYNSANTIARYHSNCQAQGNWVEMTKKSKIIVTTNREIVVSTIIATDSQRQTLLNVDSVGDLERDGNDYAVETKNTIINYINQNALTNNSMVVALVSALSPVKQKSQYVELPGGIYLSSYMGGVITWPGRNNLKVIQRNDL